MQIRPVWSKKCPYSYRDLLFYCLAATIYVFSGCAQHSQRPSSFDHIECLETIPDRVKGLKILAGPRTAKSIIRDMVPAVCHGHALFERMKSKGKEISAGSVVFRVEVEYTGEVINARVKETTIESKEFLRNLSGFIMDTDFVPWVRHDTDTVFLYPVKFGM